MVIHSLGVPVIHKVNFRCFLKVCFRCFHNKVLDLAQVVLPLAGPVISWKFWDSGSPGGGLWRRAVPRECWSALDVVLKAWTVPVCLLFWLPNPYLPKFFIAKALKPMDCSLFLKKSTNVISLLCNCSFSKPLFIRLLGVYNLGTIVSLFIKFHLSFCRQACLFAYNTTKIISCLPGRLTMIMYD